MLRAGSKCLRSVARPPKASIYLDKLIAFLIEARSARPLAKVLSVAGFFISGIRQRSAPPRSIRPAGQVWQAPRHPRQTGYKAGRARPYGKTGRHQCRQASPDNSASALIPIATTGIRSQPSGLCNLESAFAFLVLSPVRPASRGKMRNIKIRRQYARTNFAAYLSAYLSVYFIGRPRGNFRAFLRSSRTASRPTPKHFMWFMSCFSVGVSSPQLFRQRSNSSSRSFIDIGRGASWGGKLISGDAAPAASHGGIGQGASSNNLSSTLRGTQSRSINVCNARG